MSNPTVSELLNADPATKAYAIVPSDSADLAHFVNALYVGTGGTIKGTCIDGGTVEFTNVPSGSILPVMFSRIWATVASGTVAGDIVGLYK